MEIVPVPVGRNWGRRNVKIERCFFKPLLRVADGEGGPGTGDMVGVEDAVGEGSIVRDGEEGGVACSMSGARGTA